jgi:membrane protein
MSILKELVGRLFLGLKLFQRRRANLIAASATFYGVLSSLPLLMLLVTVLALALDNFQKAQESVLTLVSENFPNLSPLIYKNIELLLQGREAGQGKFDILNIAFLIFFSVSFFNATLNGIEVITQNFSNKNILNRFKALLGIGFTILFFLLISVMAPLTHYLYWATQENMFVLKLIELLPVLSGLFEWVNSLGQIVVWFLNSTFAMGLLCILYFANLYRWLFSFKRTLRECFFGAFVFGIAFIVGKSMFWLYFKFAKDNMVSNYGDFYTLIMALMWIYFVMCSFFYGACVIYAKKDKTS